MDKEVEFFTWIIIHELLHLHNNLSKNMPTMTKTSKAIFKSTKVQHEFNVENCSTCDYTIKQKQNFSLHHTETEFGVSRY